MNRPFDKILGIQTIAIPQRKLNEKPKIIFFYFI